MAKNLKDYTKAQLINIAEQLTIPKAGLANSKNNTIINKIEDMAEELGVSIPEPEQEVEVKPTSEAQQAVAKKRIKDFPRLKCVVEARDNSIKQQPVSVNEYTASIRIGEEVMLPEPIVDYLNTLKDVIHEVNKEGNVEPRYVSRFYVKEVK